MTDTQWPRFEVFEQEKEGQPHQSAGSVHAPDGEMALLNARDVFGRRPNCFSLWVVPAAHIFSQTAQEVEALTEREETEVSTAPPETYYVFQKLEQRGVHVYAGAVEAQSPLQALTQARQTLAEPKPLVWWIFPARSVTGSSPEDSESMFGPAHDKPFRDQAYYPVASLMRHYTKREIDPREDME